MWRAKRLAVKSCKLSMAKAGVAAGESGSGSMSGGSHIGENCGISISAIGVASKSAGNEAQNGVCGENLAFIAVLAINLKHGVI